MGLTLDKSPLKQPSHLLASPYPLTHPDRICTSPSSFGRLPYLLPPHASPPLPPLPPPLPPALPLPPSGTRGDGPAGRRLDAGPPARAQSPRIQRGGATREREGREGETSASGRGPFSAAPSPPQQRPPLLLYLLSAAAAAAAASLPPLRTPQQWPSLLLCLPLVV